MYSIFCIDIQWHIVATSFAHSVERCSPKVICWIQVSGHAQVIVLILEFLFVYCSVLVIIDVFCQN